MKPGDCLSKNEELPGILIPQPQSFGNRRGKNLFRISQACANQVKSGRRDPPCLSAIHFGQGLPARNRSALIGQVSDRCRAKQLVESSRGEGTVEHEPLADVTAE